MGSRRILLLVLTILVSHRGLTADDRVLLSTKTFHDESNSYTLVELDIQPHRFLAAPQTDLEFRRWMLGDAVLRRTQTFLKTVHRQSAEASGTADTDLLNYILKSFSDPADPMRQFERTSWGAAAHKVDDYFEQPSLILVVFQGTTFSADAIVGAVKFVESNLGRLSRPKIGEFGSLIQNPLDLLETGSADGAALEYENLAKALDAQVNPVPLLLSAAVESTFFQHALVVDPGLSVHLNATSELVAYHRGFGFEVDESFYRNTPGAHRMVGPAVEFEAAVKRKLTPRQRQVGTLNGEDFVEMPWQKTLAALDENPHRCERALKKTTD